MPQFYIIVLLISCYYITHVVAECGDYSADDYPDHTYLSSHKFVPHQDREMEIRIMESHKRHM